MQKLFWSTDVLMIKRRLVKNLLSGESHGLDADTALSAEKCGTSRSRLIIDPQGVDAAPLRAD